MFRTKTAHLRQMVKSPTTITKQLVMSLSPQTSMIRANCRTENQDPQSGIQMNANRSPVVSSGKLLFLYFSSTSSRHCKTSPLHIRRVETFVFDCVCVCVHMCACTRVCLIAVICWVWKKFIFSAVLYNPLGTVANWISIWCRLSSCHWRHWRC